MFSEFSISNIDSFLKPGDTHYSHFFAILLYKESPGIKENKETWVGYFFTELHLILWVPLK